MIVFVLFFLHTYNNSNLITFTLNMIIPMGNQSIIAIKSVMYMKKIKQ